MFHSITLSSRNSRIGFHSRYSNMLEVINTFYRITFRGWKTKYGSQQKPVSQIAK